MPGCGAGDADEPSIHSVPDATLLAGDHAFRSVWRNVESLRNQADVGSSHSDGTGAFRTEFMVARSDSAEGWSVGSEREYDVGIDRSMWLGRGDEVRFEGSSAPDGSMAALSSADPGDESRLPPFETDEVFFADPIGWLVEEGGAVENPIR